jgi:hypothetical protein
LIIFVDIRLDNQFKRTKVQAKIDVGVVRGNDESVFFGGCFLFIYVFE